MMRVIGPTLDRRGGTDRRASRLAFRFPDRRLGFSRRNPAAGSVVAGYNRSVAAYRAKPHALVVVLLAITTLNIADLLLTLRAVELGAVELNPIMAALIEADPLVASLFKVTIVTFVGIAIWSARRYRLILEASLVLLAAFAVLTAYTGGMLLLAS